MVGSIIRFKKYMRESKSEAEQRFCSEKTGGKQTKETVNVWSNWLSEQQAF